MLPGELLRTARTKAGLSVRALASAAKTSPTTVTRIESGAADPTFGTLLRLLDAAGFALEASLQPRPTRGPRGLELADLTRSWVLHAGREEPDWTTLRLAVDLLRQYPEQIPGAIRRKPPASGSAAVDALLASVAEKLADDAGVTRPTWTARIPSLAQEWSLPATPRMLQKWRHATPPQLTARNLVVAEETLWRPLPRQADTSPAA